MDLSHINIEDAIAPEPAVTPREPGGGNSSAEIEKVLACICSRAYTKTEHAGATLTSPTAELDVGVLSPLAAAAAEQEAGRVADAGRVSEQRRSTEKQTPTTPQQRAAAGLLAPSPPPAAAGASAACASEATRES